MTAFDFMDKHAEGLGLLAFALIVVFMFFVVAMAETRSRK